MIHYITPEDLAYKKTKHAEKQLIEVDNPDYLFPSYVEEGQRKIFLQLDSDTIYAVVLKTSLNVPIKFMPGVKSDFSGVLKANIKENKWEPFLVVQETEETTSSGNNPYYLWLDDNELRLSVVDVNGAGSGEGIMKVFEPSLSDTDNWNLVGCYYYVPGYPESSIEPNENKMFLSTSYPDFYDKLDFSECVGDVEVHVVKEKDVDN